MDKIIIGSRVYHHDYVGMFIVEEINLESVRCYHEFRPLSITFSLSEIHLHPIQSCDIAFMLQYVESYPDLCFPTIFESCYIENDYSKVIYFYYMILNQTLNNFKKFNYSKTDIEEFVTDLDTIFEFPEYHGNILEKHSSRLGFEYSNIYLIIWKEEGDGLFHNENFGDGSLQMTILSLVVYLFDKLEVEKAIAIKNYLFKDIHNERAKRLSDEWDELDLPFHP
jgi:hypothetical protein